MRDELMDHLTSRHEELVAAMTNQVDQSEPKTDFMDRLQTEIRSIEKMILEAAKLPPDPPEPAPDRTSDLISKYDDLIATIDENIEVVKRLIKLREEVRVAETRCLAAEEPRRGSSLTEKLTFAFVVAIGVAFVFLVAIGAYRP